MISRQMTKAINEQINRELFSSYLYLAMAADAMNKGYKGAAHWFTIQVGEEREHAMRLVKYLLDQDAKVELAAIAAPKTAWKDLKEMFEETLEHEKGITASICALVDTAKADNDHATQNMLQWFVNEQVEEEGNDRDVLWMLEMAATSKGALFQADRQLGKRGKG